jgi:hypothetical protein
MTIHCCRRGPSAVDAFHTKVSPSLMWNPVPGAPAPPPPPPPPGELDELSTRPRIELMADRVWLAESPAFTRLGSARYWYRISPPLEKMVKDSNMLGDLASAQGNTTSERDRRGRRREEEVLSAATLLSRHSHNSGPESRQRSPIGVLLGLRLLRTVGPRQ